MARDEFPRYAYDDDLIAATRADGRPRVRVYRLSGTAVVLGSGSRPELEIDLDACRADGVPVLRRRGGGCAVVLDSGIVIVSAVLAKMPFGHHQRHFDALTHWLIDGLNQIGVSKVQQAGICDLALGGRKVGGACMHRIRDLLFYSVSLLVDPEIPRIARYLKHPPREPAYRGGRDHLAFMGSLLGSNGHMTSCDCAPAFDQGGCATGRSAAESVAERLRQVLLPPTVMALSAHS